MEPAVGEDMETKKTTPQDESTDCGMSLLEKIFGRSHGKHHTKSPDQPEKEFRGRSSSHSSSRSTGSSSPCNSPKHRTFGFRSSSNPHVAEILPGLLLGSQEFAQDLHGLERHKVTHVLNMTMEVNNCYPEKFTYKKICIPDLPSADISQYFPECFTFIDGARSKNGCVLVHCFYGNSRSATVIMGYLIKSERMKLREAVEYLHLLRPQVHPNDGFERQLKRYEQTELLHQVPTH